MYLLGKRITNLRTMTVTNPYNKQVIDTIGQSEEKDVQRAIDIAHKGSRVLKRMPAGDRASILEGAARIIKEKEDDFARTICLESGKTICEARGEVRRAIQTMKLSAVAALEMTGETVRFDLGGSSTKMGFYERVPLGIVCAITPFNFPLNLSCHKIGPAIAAGNAVIHKPASVTPLSAIKLAEALIDAGLPLEGISVLVGPGSTIGMAMVKHEAIRKISFTGSLDVGRLITKNAGMKRITMELGSNSAIIVFKDAPLPYVAKKVKIGGYALAGQVCISVQRVYVEQEIADKFLGELSLEVRGIKLGDPLKDDTEMGPMIDEGALNKASVFCDDAKKHKGILLLGGRPEGNFFLPTIIHNTTEDALVVKEEAFAPIVVVNTFTSIEEAIDKVNNTKYGLQAGIFTSDISKALQSAQAIDAGGILINEYPTFRVDNMPYGGTKGSGLGREGPKFAIREMTEEKLIVFDRLPT
ncbi:aldehyde dehydrogenase family protein [candidate division WOR-3 bacterium]|nr:aldehyde dehydrogenase family protein [candidate division WOR-3 bacterium]